MNSDVRFGLWYDFRNPPPSTLSFETLYQENLKQISWAETLGFESVWLTEHHQAARGEESAGVVAAAVDLVHPVAVGVGRRHWASDREHAYRHQLNAAAFG